MRLDKFFQHNSDITVLGMCTAGSDFPLSKKKVSYGIYIFIHSLTLFNQHWVTIMYTEALSWLLRILPDQEKKNTKSFKNLILVSAPVALLFLHLIPHILPTELFFS